MTCVVTALHANDDTHFELFGRLGPNIKNTRPENMLFEIGSITKVFTAILLAKFVQDERIELDAPIAEIRPEFKGTPDWITPRTLSAHTSGLPRVPMPWWQLPFLSAKNPYAEFGEKELIRWMARYRPRKKPNLNVPVYSNLGVGLLGHLIAMVAGSDYETALRAHVLNPLGQQDTAITLSDDQRARLAQPHFGSGKPTPPWDMDALAGAGALRSTAADLMNVAQAVIDAPKGIGPLHAEIMMTLAIQHHGNSDKAEDQCLGWQRSDGSKTAPPIYHHDGGTLGSASALYVAPDTGVAAVILSNHGLGLWNMLRLEQANPIQAFREFNAFARPSN